MRVYQFPVDFSMLASTEFLETLSDIRGKKGEKTELGKREPRQRNTNRGGKIYNLFFFNDLRKHKLTTYMPSPVSCLKKQKHTHLACCDEIMHYDNEKTQTD